MASFDVVSLFTNIPVNETIGIISNALFSDHQFYYVISHVTTESHEKRLRASLISACTLVDQQGSILRQETFVLRFVW